MIPDVQLSSRGLQLFFKVSASAFIIEFSLFTLINQPVGVISIFRLKKFRMKLPLEFSKFN